MPGDTLLKQLLEFFKAARHLWGRCPACGNLFRMSDAAISFGSEPPRDWLRKLERREAGLAGKEDKLEGWQAQLALTEQDIGERERRAAERERYLDKEAAIRAQEMMKSDPKIKDLLRQARQEAAQRSRSTLLGKLFERLAPFLQDFDHDPRDIRAIMDPIDYVCFDGLTATGRAERITFVEVKSGTSSMSQRQRSIMHAVRDGRVAIETWQFGDKALPIHQQLMSVIAPRAHLPAGKKIDDEPLP